MAAQLTELVNGPIAATSANISGQAEILDLSTAITQFEGQVDAIIKVLLTGSIEHSFGSDPFTALGY